MQRLSAVVLVLMLALTAGCTALTAIENSPMTAQLVTNQLTLRFIAGSDEPVQRAAEVRKVVAEIRGQVDGSKSFTLAEIDQAVRERIDWQSLSMADQELADFALTKARQALAELIGEGRISGGETETIGTLLAWIDNAAMRVQ